MMPISDEHKQWLDSLKVGDTVGVRISKTALSDMDVIAKIAKVTKTQFVLDGAKFDHFRREDGRQVSNPGSYGIRDKLVEPTPEFIRSANRRVFTNRMNKRFEVLQKNAESLTDEELETVLAAITPVAIRLLGSK